MNEGSVSRRLREAMTSLGAKVWKVSDRFHASRPDLAVCFQGKFIVIETKIHPNEPTPSQQHELDEIRAAGGTCYVATYNKTSKWLTILDCGDGAKTDFKDIRSCAQWLLRHRA